MTEENKTSPVQKITVVFTDMVGSSAYFHRYGNIAGRKMLDEHARMVSPIVLEHGGVLVKTIGDCTMSYFMNTQEALKAAVKIQKRIQEYAAGAKSDHQIRIRIAVHYGDGLIEKEDIFGDVVNTAAKFLPLVPPDTICVTEDIRNAVQDSLPLRYEMMSLAKDKSPVSTVFLIDWRDEIELLPVSRIAVLLKPISLLGAKSLGSKWTSVLNHLHTFSQDGDLEPGLLDDGIILAWFYDLHDALRKTGSLLAGLRSEYLPGMQLQSFPIQILFHKDTTGCKNETLPAVLSFKWENLRLDCMYLTRAAYDLWTRGRAGREVAVPDGELYRLDEKEKIFEENELCFLHKELLLVGTHKECFYCGQRRHGPSSCPSKNFDLPPKAISVLGSLPVGKLAGNFSRVFTDLEQWTNAAAELKETDLAVQSLKKELPVSCLALFDITDVFQLRCLRRVWQSESNTWRDFRKNRLEKKAEGGKLALVLDCIRVNQPGKAESLLRTLEDKELKDYRVYLINGLLNIEAEDYYQALYHFERARELSSTQLQKIYALFLTARSYEVLEDYSKAEDAISKILFIESDCLEANYRKVVLLVKSGEYSTALNRLRNLILQQPDFFLYSLIDSQFIPVQKLTGPMLGSLLQEMEVRASERLTNAENALKTMAIWFDNEDETYKDYKLRLEKISQLYRTGTYLGFVETENLAGDLLRRCNNLRSSIQAKLRKDIAEFKAKAAAYQSAWDKYPYKALFKNMQEELQTLSRKATEATLLESKFDDPGLFKRTKMLVAGLAADFDALKPVISRTEAVENAMRNLVFFGRRVLLLEILVAIFGLIILPGALIYLTRIYPDLGLHASNDVWPYQKIALTIGGLGSLLIAGLMTLKSIWNS